MWSWELWPGQNLSMREQWLLEGAGAGARGLWPGCRWSIVSVEHEQSHRLECERSLTMTYLLESKGVPPGVIRPRGLWFLWMRPAVIGLPALPLPIVLFVFWLVITTWHTELNYVR